MVGGGHLALVGTTFNDNVLESRGAHGGALLIVGSRRYVIRIHAPAADQ